MRGERSPERLGDQPAVQLTGVVKRLGRRTVLDGADLSVAPGAFVVVTGRSGVGKSTTLHLIASLDDVDGGEIRVFGRPVGRHQGASRYRRETVGIVFQLHNLIARMSARQNVEVAMFGTGRSRRQRVDRAEELLVRLGLGDQLDSRPPNMSGGERQRVAIARALANRPRLVLADEPTGNLDDHSADLVRGLLREIVDDEGTTVLAVSHDARLDERADRLVVLEAGDFREPTGTGSRSGPSPLGDRPTSRLDQVEPVERRREEDTWHR